jgi:RNA polymerase sigma-70 factor, ECF subfamily
MGLVDDKILLKAIRKLDQDALTSVFEQYAPLVYKYALRVCHSPLEADDVVGEVFSRLVDCLGKGTGPHENLRAYLYQTAYHVIVDNARRRKYDASPDELLQIHQMEDSIQKEAETRHNLQILQAAIHSALSEDQKHVIILRFLEGFNLQETATILGKGVNNIKVIQNRALAKLRQAFDSTDFEAKL